MTLKEQDPVQLFYSRLKVAGKSTFCLSRKRNKQSLLACLYVRFAIWKEMTLEDKSQLCLAKGVKGSVHPQISACAQEAVHLAGPWLTLGMQNLHDGNRPLSWPPASSGFSFSWFCVQVTIPGNVEAVVTTLLQARGCTGPSMKPGTALASGKWVHLPVISDSLVCCLEGQRQMNRESSCPLLDFPNAHIWKLTVSFP